MFIASFGINIKHEPSYDIAVYASQHLLQGEAVNDINNLVSSYMNNHYQMNQSSSSNIDGSIDLATQLDPSNFVNDAILDLGEYNLDFKTLLLLNGEQGPSKISLSMPHQLQKPIMKLLETATQGMTSAKAASAMIPGTIEWWSSADQQSIRTSGGFSTPRPTSQIMLRCDISSEPMNKSLLSIQSGLI